MAVTQIEKLFGKGSIMKLGEKPIEAVAGSLNGFYRPGYSTRGRRPSAGPGH